MISAVNKIKSGKDIEFSEADAISTLWHEITHNRNKISYESITRLQRNYMELANEFVARKTLPEFYRKIGAKDTPFLELMNTRASTGYNDWVCNYDAVIKTLKLNENKILENVKYHLFNDSYLKQKDGLIDAIMEQVNEKSHYKTEFTRDMITELIEECIK